MIKVSMTRFIEFVAKAGTPRDTVVRKIMNEGDYDPKTDFYKYLREAIVEFHETGGNDTNILKVACESAPAKKQNGYKVRMQNYEKFLKGKTYKWFEPPKEEWSYGDLRIRVNPEVGLIIEGKPLVIKFALSQVSLNRYQMDIIHYLMRTTLANKLPKDCEFIVLHLGTGQVFSGTSPDKSMRPILASEASAFQALWNEIELE